MAYSTKHTVENDPWFYFFCNVMVAIIVNTRMVAWNIDNLGVGMMTGILSLILTLVGVACMVAEGASGDRSVTAQMFGFVFLAPPAIFIVHTVSRFGSI